MGDYFDLLRDFEVKKRTVTRETKGFVTIKMCLSLKEIYEHTEKFNLSNKISLDIFDLSGKVDKKGDKMKIDSSIVRSWFEDPIKKIIHHVRETLAEVNIKDVNTILLVGGFGESLLLQTEMKSQFPNKTLLVPDEAGFAVLKGVVKCGHCPDIVSSRVMKFTYGIGLMCEFDENSHPLSERLVDEDGVARAKHGFHKFVEIGQDVSCWHQVTHVSRLYRDITSASLKVFCSTEKDPVLTTSPSCTLLRTLEIKYQTDKIVIITINFEDTELIVMAKFKKSGKEFQKYIYCLSLKET